MRGLIAFSGLMALVGAGNRGRFPGLAWRLTHWSAKPSYGGQRVPYRRVTVCPGDGRGSSIEDVEEPKVNWSTFPSGPQGFRIDLRAFPIDLRSLNMNGRTFPIHPQGFGIDPQSFPIGLRSLNMNRRSVRIDPQG